jgi:coenzyme F420-dependent glucose-6-phosphate dehydrogenase
VRDVHEAVTHDGRVRVEAARLYTRLAVPPAILGDVIMAESARWAAGWADGLLTLGGAPENVRYTIDGFYKGGGTSKPVYLQIALSYAHNEPSTCQEAYKQWCTNVFPSEALAELWMPA